MFSYRKTLILSFFIHERPILGPVRPVQCFVTPQIMTASADTTSTSLSLEEWLVVVTRWSWNIGITESWPFKIELAIRLPKTSVSVLLGIAQGLRSGAKCMPCWRMFSTVKHKGSVTGYQLQCLRCWMKESLAKDTFFAESHLPGYHCQRSYCSCIFGLHKLE